MHGIGELPLAALLAAHGVAQLDEPAQRAQALGLRVSENNASGVQIKTVLRGGAAEQAGFAAGDDWIGIELPPARRGQTPAAWRIVQLDDLALYLGAQNRCTAIVARDRRLLRLPLQLPQDQTSWRLVAQDAPLLSAWLQVDTAPSPA